MQRATPIQVLTAAAVAGAFLIVYSTFVDVLRYHHALPFWDAWATVSDFKSIYDGTYSIRDLFGQHNEHRIAFPRLFEFADFALFSGTGWFPVTISFALQVGSALILSFVATGARPAPLSAITTATIFTVTFSAIQIENLSEPFQIAFICVIAAFTVAIFATVAATFRAKEGKPFASLYIAALIALTLATYSAANGILAGAGMALVIILMRGRPMLLLGVVAATAILAVCYFTGYAPVGRHPSMTEGLHHPRSFVLYIAAFLGSPMLPFGLWPSIWAGLVGLVLAAAALLVSFRAAPRQAALAFFVGLMAIIVLDAIITAIGRLGFGIEQALSARYTSFGLIFWAAQIGFWPRLCRGAHCETLARGLVVAEAAAVLAVVGWTQIWSDPEMDGRIARIRAASDALISDVNDDGAILGAYPDPARVKTLIPFLKAQKLSVFATIDARILGAPLANAFSVVPANDVCLGSFDAADTLPGSGPDALRATGWAWDILRRASPSRIILADKDGKIVGFGSTGGERPDALAAILQAGFGPTTRPFPGMGWTGFARSPTKQGLQAFAEIEPMTVCPIGIPVR